MYQLNSLSYSSIIEKRKKIYASGKRDIAFIIRSYASEDQDTYTLQSIKSFCDEYRIAWLEPKDERIGDTRLEQILNFSFLCDFGIIILPPKPNENVSFEIGLMTALGKKIFILKNSRKVKRKLPFDYGDFVYISYNTKPNLWEFLVKEYDLYLAKYSKQKAIKEIINKAFSPLKKTKTNQLENALVSLKVTPGDNNDKNYELFLELWEKNPSKVLRKLEQPFLLELARHNGISNLNTNPTRLIKQINDVVFSRIAEKKSKQFFYPHTLKIIKYIIQNFEESLKYVKK
ncbi:MAG: nucleotide-binding protein [Candidatus Heimdallarchaeum endolithica]|uniref:Nucleotide-binding protein n=1 Tax=Candidatus Heimdallarchaeum endolithica TaxID=2876572 RepID=A0A9Y1BR14_9ARCH|nr:MAG: nucleotide-binding protein [Candidatus Heimdallarchaeum endolithica]